LKKRNIGMVWNKDSKFILFGQNLWTEVYKSDNTSFKLAEEDVLNQKKGYNILINRNDYRGKEMSGFRFHNIKIS
jgi:hypothetical protein